MMMVKDVAGRQCDMRNEDSVRIANDIVSKVKDYDCLPYI